MRARVLLVVLAITGGVLQASPVGASEQVLWWNDNGDTHRTVGPNAMVTIHYGEITTECDKFGPVADIYVIDEALYGQKLVDHAGLPNTVFGASGGAFVDEIIALTAPGGRLGVGTYDIVYDECQNGWLDAEDKVFHDAITVDIPAEVPPVDPYIHQIKAGAKQKFEAVDKWMRIAEWLDTLEKIKELQECLAGSVVSCGSAADRWLLDGKVAAFIDEVASGWPSLPDPKDIAKDVLADMITHYRGIYADPPDPDFRRTSPLLSAPVTTSGGSAPWDLEVAAIASAGAVDVALAESLLRSIERYKGADAANDAEWALAHARAIVDRATALAEAANATSSAFTSFADLVETEAGALDALAAEENTFRRNIVHNGFDADQIATLLNAGIEVTQLPSLRNFITSQQHLAEFSEAAMIADTRAVAASSAALIPVLETLAADVQIVVEQLASDPAVDGAVPVADAGGPYLAEVGESVALSAAGSTDRDGTIAGYAWDLDGDGAPDDATTVDAAVTFDSPGVRVVSVEVTDDAGNAALGTATVTVTAAGSPPVFDTASPDADALTLLLGESATFSIATSDVDGDALSTAWSLDRTPSGDTGSMFTYAPTDLIDVGHHRVAVVVTDGHDTVERDWWIRVYAPDADADGWRANADCDDNDPARSPGNQELLGNGIDDDCSAASADVPVGGIPGKVMGWGWNRAGGVGDGTYTARSQPTYSLYIKDAVAVDSLGGDASMALMSDGRVMSWGLNGNGQLGRDGWTAAPGYVQAPAGETGHLTGVIEIAGGHYHTLGRRSDGTVVGWGSGYGVGDGTHGNHPVPAPTLTGPDGPPLTGTTYIDAGYNSMAITEDGRLLHWGSYSGCQYGQAFPYYPTPVPNVDPRNVVEADVEHGFISAFRYADGSVTWCDGYQGKGQILPPGSAVRVSTGSRHVLVLTPDGRVLSFGSNRYGELGRPATTGAELLTPAEVLLPPGPPVVAIEAGPGTSFAVRADGTAWAWGTDNYEVLGNGAAGGGQTPTRMPMPDGVQVREIASGSFGGLLLVGDAPDAPPALSLSASVADATTVTEGSTLSFPVTLSHISGAAVTVGWQVVGGVGEITTTSGTLTIPAGETTGTIAIPTVDDGRDDTDRTVSIALVDPVGASLSDDWTASGLVSDDDVAPALSVASTDVTEGHAGYTTASLTVTLSAPSNLPVSVGYATSAGSATGGVDYSDTFGILEFAPGVTEQTVTVDVFGDYELEPNETFAFHLEDAANAGLPAGPATVTIHDDEPYVIEVGAVEVVESAGTARVVVTAVPAPPAGETVVLSVVTQDGSALAGSDHAALDTTIELTADLGSVEIPVTILDDTVREDTELLKLRVRSTEASSRPVLLQGSGLITILDDEPDAPTVTIDPVGSVAEGQAATLRATVGNGDGETAAWSWSAGADVDAGASCSIADPAAPETTIVCTDDGNYDVTLTVGAGSDSQPLVVTNAVPLVTAVTNDGPVVVGDAVEVTAVVGDPGGNDTHTCSLDWGDGSLDRGDLSGGSCSGNHTFAQPGTYVVTVTALDDDDDTGSSSTEVVVADRSGSATGGGFVDTPVGSATDQPDASGDSRFGFTVGHPADGHAPQGSVELQFQTAGFEFHSTSVDRLVITGAQVLARGAGRVGGEDGYGFQLSAIDGGRDDRFRLIVWQLDSGNVVYDSQPGEDRTAPPTSPVRGSVAVRG